MDLDLKKLNKAQLQAVTYDSGPFLLVAGAGTGKTAVIVKRIAYLIKNHKASPEQILGLSFSDKAAEEMEERVDRLLPIGYCDLWISTFHSFCRRVLEQHGLDIGIPIDFKMIDSTGSWILARENIEDFHLNYYKPLANPSKFIHALIQHFSKCKDQMVEPQDYLKYSNTIKKDIQEKERIQEIANAYQVYNNLLLENNCLDFNDLINYCLQLFKKRPRILEKYREKFKYILVDEFQDTNWAQYQLVKLLAFPNKNLLVAADDDQAIYRFRGASFTNIIQFQKDFPKTKQIVLTKNYRSAQNILDLSYNLIQLNNPNRLEHQNKINKKLSANKKDEGIIKHLHYQTLEQAVHGIVNEIHNILDKDQNTDFNSFAVLARSNNSIVNYANGFERADIPYQFLAFRGLYSKSVILDIISYFKLLDNYHEESAVYRALNMPFLNISTEDIAKIVQYSKRKSQPIYSSLKKSELIPGLKKQTQQSIANILMLVKKHSKLIKQRRISEIFIAFLQDSGYLKHLIKKQDSASLGFISQFFDKIKNFEEIRPDSCLRNFMAELDLELESGEEGKLSFDIEQGPNTVKLMTVHSAKGLEFEYVFIVDLVDRRFPSSQRSQTIEIPQPLIKDIIPDGNIHIQEERRLFYVAMTRAKKGLFFISAEDYGGVRRKKPSQFLKELGYTKQESEKPRDILKRPLAVKSSKKAKIALPSYFSFTQLKAFENCPLQYKFAHILKIPVNGKASFSYGRTLHQTLFNFMKQGIVDKDIKFKDILKIFRQEWIDDWYESENQKQKYFELGKATIKKFYNDFTKFQPTVLLIDSKPALEQEFTLKIEGETIKGKIDRIDKIDNGVELIDYKTGAFKEKLTTKDKEQLLIYQIAAKDVLGLTSVKLSYYYLDECQKVSFLGKEKDLEKQKLKIVKSIKQIENSKFIANPGWHCKFCDFKNICEFSVK